MVFPGLTFSPNYFEGIPYLKVWKTKVEVDDFLDRSIRIMGMPIPESTSVKENRYPYSIDLMGQLTAMAKVPHISFYKCGLKSFRKIWATMGTLNITAKIAENMFRRKNMFSVFTIIEGVLITITPRTKKGRAFRILLKNSRSLKLHFEMKNQGVSIEMRIKTAISVLGKAPGISPKI